MASAGAIAAATAVGEAAKYAIKNRHAIEGGVRDGISIAKQIHSGIKPLANQLMTVRGRRKAASTILSKIKNPLRSAKEASQFISSGKAAKMISSAAGVANRAANAAEAISGKDMSNAKSIINRGAGEAQRYHDIIHKYNEQGKQFVGSL